MSKVERKGGAGRVSLPMILCLIIIFSACLLLIYGLAETLPHLIAVETGQMISEDKYYERYHDPDWEYYGKYGKCYASLSKEGINTPSSETVGGLKFEYETQSKIRIFYGRRFYSLIDAYEGEYLSDDDLDELYRYHTEISKIKEYMDIYPTTAPVSLYEYEIYNIFYDFCSRNGLFDRPEELKGSRSLNCLYKSNGVYAIFMYSENWGSADMQVTDIVNGFEFEYPSSETMSIYHNGQSYSVKGAFERGVLTDEMLAELHKAFIEHYDEFVLRGGLKKKLN